MPSWKKWEDEQFVGADGVDADKALVTEYAANQIPEPPAAQWVSGRYLERAKCRVTALVVWFLALERPAEAFVEQLLPNRWYWM